MAIAVRLYKHPLTSSLDKLIHQQREILQDKSADVEREKLSRMSGAKLQPNLGLICVSKARVLDLAGDLIWR